MNLATVLRTLGDLPGAQALQERVLAIFSRTLSDDHLDLQRARDGLALTLFGRGDLAGARALQEKVLEVLTRVVPDDHSALQHVRGNLAMTLQSLGELAEARALNEKVAEVFSRTLPAEHPDALSAHTNLALTLGALGDLEGARALFEEVLAVRSRVLPDDHPDLQWARFNVATTAAGQFARAQRAAGSEASAQGARLSERERCAELVGAQCRSQVRAAREAILVSPAREAEERCSSMITELDLSLSFANGFGAFEPLPTLVPESFLFSETTRAAAIVSAGLARTAAHSPRYAPLRAALRTASDDLAVLARSGTTSDAFDQARARREAAERELVVLAREGSGGIRSTLDFDVESLAEKLGDRAAAVGFRRFVDSRIEVVDELDALGRPAVRETRHVGLCAFIVRRLAPGATPDASPSLVLVDLGPLAPIQDAVRAWRGGLQVGDGGRGLGVGVEVDSVGDAAALGAALREKCFDPLLPALAGAQRLVVVLDDVLHLVPLEALPLDEKTLVGDRWQIETRATLIELVHTTDASKESGGLLAFGDIEHLASVAYFDVVSMPSNPPSIRLITVRCRSLTGRLWMRCHSRALWSTAASVSSAPSIARPKWRLVACLAGNRARSHGGGQGNHRKRCGE